VICGSAFITRWSSQTCGKNCFSKLGRINAGKSSRYQLAPKRTDIFILEAARQMEALNWHLYGVGLYRKWQPRKFTREQMNERQREQRRKSDRIRRQRELAALKVYREMGFSVSRRDRRIVYLALKAELPNLNI
jgi:hypothetical protein